jgi:hypothetical protein
MSSILQRRDGWLGLTGRQTYLPTQHHRPRIRVPISTGSSINVAPADVGHGTPGPCSLRICLHRFQSETAHYEVFLLLQKARFIDWIHPYPEPPFIYIHIQEQQNIGNQRSSSSTSSSAAPFTSSSRRSASILAVVVVVVVSSMSTTDVTAM